MSISETLLFLLLGALLGLAGQILRAVVGIKKAQEEAAGRPAKEWFNGKELGFSLLVGAVAGLLAAVTQYEPDIAVNRDLMMGMLAAGYAGADFITGLMKKWLP